MAQAAGYLGNTLISTQYTKGKGWCFIALLNAKKGWKFTLHNVFVIVLKAMKRKKFMKKIWRVVEASVDAGGAVTSPPDLLHWVVELQDRVDPLCLPWPITGISPNYYISCYGEVFLGEKAAPLCSPAGWPLHAAEGPVLILHVS